MSITLNDTIAALATPPGLGGMAVLRVSGPAAWTIAHALSRPPTLVGGQQGGISNRAYTTLPSPPAEAEGRDLANSARFARIIKDGELVDEVVVTLYKGPHSYTGEDVAEISCHGGRYAATRILELVFEHGARPARPGEFTERAFLNGKLDLAQAEAVASLIHARTARAGIAAARQLAGGLSEKVKTMRSRLLDLLSLLELELDFSEEDVEFQARTERLSTVRELQAELKALSATFRQGRLVREGIRVSLVGAPNAGKSTLLNALIGEERAIVSPEPGTTRDVVEAHIELDGIEVILQDTAGVRVATGVIESEGIARTRRSIENADIILLVVDETSPHWPEADTLSLLIKRSIILVQNKIDLCTHTEPAELAAPGQITPVSFRAVSALTGQGIPELRHDLVALVIGEDIGNEEIVVAEARHHEALLKAEESLRRALAQLTELTLMAADLRDAVDALGEITGETVSEDVLDRIFSKFCIGK